MLWVTKLCGDGGWYARAWQTELQDPQNPPKHLARAVSNEKRPEMAAKNGDQEAQRGRGSSNGGSSEMGYTERSRDQCRFRFRLIP